MEQKTMKEMCELISKWMKETKGIIISPKEIYEYSPTGELSAVFFLYQEAKSYFNSFC
ncbi:TPA: hypothetical protein ACGN8S_002228 [Bacillus cereus]